MKNNMYSITFQAVSTSQYIHTIYINLTSNTVATQSMFKGS